MRLVIISHTAHYNGEDAYVGWGPTVREISYLSTLFTEVRHVAFLHKESPPTSSLPYSTNNLTIVPVPSRGGNTIGAKLRLFIQIPRYLWVLRRECLPADVIHVRCPSSISLVAIILLALRRFVAKRWIKYAGNWKPSGREALSYTFQRWWLKRNFARAKVTVNGEWADSPPHVHAFLNPCLTREESIEGSVAARTKKLEVPMRFVFVGRIEEAKGIGIALKVIAALRAKNQPVCFDIIGDGEERPRFEQLAKNLGLESVVRFHGWMGRTEINRFYHQAHFMLLPSSSSEGWPKVLSEAMCYGVVPIASNVSSIPQYLAKFGCGRAIDPQNMSAYEAAVLEYINEPALWLREAQAASLAAEEFTYENYVDKVRQLLDL